MGQFCGTTVPGVVETTTSELKIVFTSDSSVSQSGFRLTHQTVGEFEFYSMIARRIASCLVLYLTLVSYRNM